MDPFQQRAEELLAAGLEEFEAFIDQLINGLTVEREEGDYVFTLCKEANPNALSLKLRDLLVSENSDICTVSAYLLRVHFLQDALIWNELEEANSSAIVRTFREEVHNIEDEKARRNFCEALSAAISMTGSSDLLWTTVQWVTRSNPRSQEIGTLILANCEPPFVGVLSVVEHLHYQFSDCLIEGTLSVKVSVIKASCKFLPYVLFHRGFKNLLPLMVNAVRGMIREGEVDEVFLSLEELRLMIYHEPRCLVGKVKVLSKFLKISSEETLTVATRRLSLQFVLDLLRRANEMAPEMMPSLQAYIKMLLQHLMEMLTDFEEIVDWFFEGELLFEPFIDRWRDNTWEYLEEAEAFQVSRECMHELALVLDRQADIPIASPELLDELSEYVFQLLGAYMNGGGGNGWQAIHSGIFAFAILGEKALTNDSIMQLVNTLVSTLKREPHPIVQWTGISTLIKLYRAGDRDLKHLICPLTYEFTQGIISSNDTNKKSSGSCNSSRSDNNCPD